MLNIDFNHIELSQAQILSQLQQRLFINGPVTVFRWLAKEPWSVEYVSPNVRQWGYQAEDFLTGKINYKEIVHPEDLPQIVAELETYEKAGIDSYRQEYRLICAHGELRWVHEHSVVVRNSQGIVTRYEGYILDITKRKQGEKALEESEEKFAKAFQCSPDPITISRLSDGRLIDVNESFLQVSGYAYEEVIGKNSLELNLWLNPQQRAQVFQKLKEQGSIKNCEYEFRHQSGRTIIGLFSAAVVSINGESCLLSVTTDITERKQAESELFLAAQREKLLGEMATRIRQSLNLQAILTTTVEEVRQFLQVNRVYIVQFNEQVRGKILAESVTDGCQSIINWQPRSERQIQEISDHLVFEQVYALTDIDELELPPEIASFFQENKIRSLLAVPILLGQDFFGHLVANSCQQIRVWKAKEIEFIEKLANQVAIAIQQAQLYQQIQTLNTNLEALVAERTAQLSQKMAELQQLYRVKDTFLHAFSHDLRTPIMGTSLVLNSLLNQEGESITVSRSVLERLQEGSEKQLTLMNALLEAHSSDVSGIKLNCRPLQLSELIESIIADLEPLANKYQGKLVNFVESPLPLVNADAIQLRRVFGNLITNALKYNPPPVTVKVNATLDAGEIYCTVADNGAGIAPEEQEHLFDLYYRGHQNRASTGIGLGLYLCKQIIKAHGGKIGVNSVPGNGSAFRFSLTIC